MFIFLAAFLFSPLGQHPLTALVVGGATGQRTSAHSLRPTPAAIVHLGAPSGSGTAIIVSSAGQVDLPPAVVGSTSPPAPIDLLNETSAAIGISAFRVTGDFAETDDCLPVLQPGARCVIDVVFEPTTAGPASGTLAATLPGGADLAVALSGVAVQPEPALQLPRQVEFKPVAVGDTESQQLVMVNTAAVPILLTRISANGDFSETDGCGEAIYPARTCTLSLTFAPTVSGPRHGSISIDSASGTVATVGLVGEGAAGKLTLSRTKLDFAPTTLGDVAAAQRISVSNTGGSPLQLDAIIAAGDFAESNDCPASLVVGAACSVQVVAVPAATGERGGLFLVSSGQQLAVASLSVKGISANGGNAQRRGVAGLSLAAGLGFGVPLIAPRIGIGSSRTPRKDFEASRYLVELPATSAASQAGDSTVVTNLTRRSLDINVAVVGSFAASGCDLPIESPRGQCTVTVSRTPGAARAHGALIISDESGFTVTVALRAARLPSGPLPWPICAAPDLGICAGVIMGQCPSVGSPLAVDGRWKVE